ncbi:MAG: metallophosphoesterase [Helicobacteraceae bacterium]|jgi:predicted MPP superfamily phosphohydrolase|nr:metallophosphoesterase [Helicobacteraceae bacterium]
MSKFFIISALVYLLMSAAICYALIRPLPIRNIVKKSLYFLVFFCVILSVSYLPLRRTEILPGYFEDLFALFIGIVYVFFMFSLIADWSARITKIIIKSDRFSVKIRAGFSALATLYLIYGVCAASTAPIINKITIKSDKIIAPITIAHLTDLHIGNGAALMTSFAERIAAQTSDLNADIIVITGDLFDAKLDKIKEPIAAATKVKSKYGIYFVSGNHELFSDAIAAMDYLEELNVTTLRNASINLKGDFGEIYIAGILDISGKRPGAFLPDANLSLKNTKNDNFILALSHQPNGAFLYPENSFDLMLSGHTHGGQIFPFNFLVGIANDFVAGLYDIDDRRKIYVSRGVGYWGPALRMFAPNEIALITIEPIFIR